MQASIKECRMAVVEFVPTGLRERLLAGLLRASLRWLLMPVFAAHVPIARQRARLAALAKTTLLPKGVRFEVATVGGVPGEWVRLAERDGIQAPRRGTLLYLHGGAYCLGAAATHRNITSRLARLSGMDVFALDYRLAPEHPFPAAVHDALAAALALQARGALVIAGDSAGGGLALTTTLALRDGGHALPTALLLFSPWVDMTLADAPAAAVKGEAMLSLPWARACAALCLGKTDASHPWASPLKADLIGLPPVLIQVGTDELLHAAPAPGLANGQSERQLRDHTRPLACLPGPRGRLAQRRRSDATRRALCRRTAGRCSRRANHARAPRARHPGRRHVGPVHGHRAQARRVA
jgi:acetyl esterase/lipase